MCVLSIAKIARVRQQMVAHRCTGSFGIAAQKSF
jgi:hypothetical protein